MKEGILADIRAAVKTAFSELQRAPVPQEGQWAFVRGPNGWQGSFEGRPAWNRLVSWRDPIMSEYSETLHRLLTSEYPDQMRMVGTFMGCGPIQPHMVLGQLAHEAVR